MKPVMPSELVSLLQRFNQLGRLLPQDDLQTAFQDAGARAEAKIVLQEMEATKKQIDNFLAVARERVPP
jgi:hypothetical protein